VQRRACRTYEFARIDQVFKEKGFRVELLRRTGLTGVPRHHGHVAQNAHDDPACARGHSDVNGSDNRTDLHDISPFCVCRLGRIAPVNVTIEKRRVDRKSCVRI
jgi:hypothetical protein